MTFSHSTISHWTISPRQNPTHTKSHSTKSHLDKIPQRQYPTRSFSHKIISHWHKIPLDKIPPRQNPTKIKPHSHKIPLRQNPAQTKSHKDKMWFFLNCATFSHIATSSICGFSIEIYLMCLIAFVRGRNRWENIMAFFIREYHFFVPRIRESLILIHVFYFIRELE